MMSEKWIPAKSHVNGSLTASHTPFQRPSSSSSWIPPAETNCLYCAMAASSSVSHRRLVLLGKFGMNQNAMQATKILTIPSSKMNHCQAWRPAMPSMLVRMPAARSPENIFETIFPACHMPIRSGDSFFVYHDEVIRETAGTNGPSATPTRKRQRQKPQAEVRAGMQIVTADHASMILGNMMLGLPFAMNTLAGTWEMM